MPDNETMQIEIDNLKCGGCANSIVKGLSELDGVSGWPLHHRDALPSLASHASTATGRAAHQHAGAPLGRRRRGRLRIAALLNRCAAEAGHTLQPWKMRLADVPDGRTTGSTEQGVTMAANAINFRGVSSG